MGVICYVLLAGYPPFYDEDQKRLFRKIKEGKYHFHEDYWGNISPAAMDMIRKMLCVNQNERWSAQQLLSHAWITAGDEELLAKDLTKSIEAMKKFNAKMRFKAVAKAIMATKRMQNAFKTKAKSTTSSLSSLLTASDSAQPPDEGSDMDMLTGGMGHSTAIGLTSETPTTGNLGGVATSELKGITDRVMASSLSTQIEATEVLSKPIEAMVVDASSACKPMKAKNKNKHQIRVNLESTGDSASDDESYLKACID